MNERALAQFELWANTHLDPIHAEEAARKLRYVLCDGDYIDTVFSFVGCGAYKEVYELCNGWVVKFCSVSNPTMKERALLAAAAEYGVEEIFLPTCFFELDDYITGSYLTIEDFGCPSYCSYDCDRCGESKELIGWIEVQPIIEELCVDAKDKETFYDETDYGAHPIILDGKLLQYHKLHLKAYYLTWLHSIVEFYGDEFFYMLNNFAKDFSIHDLHGENIGYYRKEGALAPCILDWMSREV